MDAIAPELDQQPLLARALEGAANAVLITDRAGRILWVNDAFCRLSGYSRQEALGRTPHILYSGAQGRELYRGMWQTILLGRPWQGELVERHRDGSLYTVSQVISPLLDASGRVTHFLAIQQDVSAGAKEREEIRRLAYLDAVTGLPNRAHFLALLSDALHQGTASDEGLAVMFLDLDRFKNVNDTLGHAVGDRLLKAAGERLCAALRKSDTVGRLGGDEFGIMARALGGASVAETLTQKLVNAIAQPFMLDDQRINIGASVGISLYPKDGDTPDVLLAHADSAMYRAKTEGRSCYRFFQGSG
jgi:diguanylate cyclase (GGDEF)-like protein/PAS domain S-box-containing protein